MNTWSIQNVKAAAKARDPLATHLVVDVQTGTFRVFGSSKAAYRWADRKDAEYGAVRYSVFPI